MITVNDAEAPLRRVRCWPCRIAVVVAWIGIGRNAVIQDDSLADALTKAIAGDEAGFAVLWRSLQPAVLRYLRVVVGDSAEDVASEMWLQAARDLRGFDGGVPAFRVWLFRIARHRGIDELRRTGRRREESTESFEEQATRSPVRDAAAEVLEEMGTARALELIATLPAHQAEAVMLRVVAGLDVASAARVLGKRLGAVRVATMRGLRRLAADLQVRVRHGEAGTGGTATDPRPEGVTRRDGAALSASIRGSGLDRRDLSRRGCDESALRAGKIGFA